MSLERRILTLASGMSIAAASLSGCSVSERFNSDDFVKHFDERGAHITDDSGRGKPYIFAFGGYGMNILALPVNYIWNNSNVHDYTTLDLGAWPETMPLVKDEVHKGREIIFMAHSLGCADAIEAAAELDKVDVPVSLVFFDPVHYNMPFLGIGRKKMISDNVPVVINFYATHGFLRGDVLDRKYLLSQETELLNFPCDVDHNDFIEEEYYWTYLRILSEELGIERLSEPKVLDRSKDK